MSEQAIKQLKLACEKFIIKPDYVSCRPDELQATMSMDLAKELQVEITEVLVLLLAEKAEIALIRGFVKMALDELGVPNKDYPAPVANAVSFLKEALEAKPISLSK